MERKATVIIIVSSSSMTELPPEIRDTRANTSLSTRAPSRRALLAGIGLLCAAIAAFAIYAYSSVKNDGITSGTDHATTSDAFLGKKIMYVDSYHEGYEWSDGITSGVRSVLDDTGIELRIIRMDTKRNPAEAFKAAGGEKARQEIEAFRPDVLIVSDDNAFKYIVQKFYMNAALPVVFCGLNWDASTYDAPYKNTTGMVEVSLTTRIIDHLRLYAKGDRLGYLSAETETEHKNLEWYKKLFGLNFTKEYFVKDMASWKKAFSALQQETDLVIFENNAGILDWDNAEAAAYAKEHSRVPVGTTNPWTMPESLLGITKVPEEQGIWSAKTALAILAGARPDTIPLVTNKQGRLIVNLTIAEELGIVVAPDVLKNAEIVR